VNMSKDSFSIDVVLRHPSYSRESIAKALSIKPRASLAADDKTASSHGRRTFFHARLSEGKSSSDYENALADVILFLEKNATFWTDFVSGQGEVEVILNHTFLEEAEQGDLCLKLHLEPRFLAQLSNRGIALRVQAWKGQPNAKDFSPPRPQRLGQAR
jgi:hypothetical protein